MLPSSHFLRLWSLVWLLSMSAVSVFAQDDAPRFDESLIKSEKTVLVYLKDGTTLRGVILEAAGGNLRLKTDTLGEVVLAYENIDRIETQAEGYYKNGQFWFRNPHSSRYFFAPSAVPLEKGEGYYQNAYIFVNSVAVGVTDHFTMGGGFVLNPTFQDWQLLFITPKISFPTQSNVRFSVGSISGGLFNTRYTYDPVSYTSRRDGIEVEWFGIAYGNMTIGDSERNGTVGLGWAYGGGDVASSPILNLNYMTRVGRKVGLVTENWILLPGKNNPTVGLLSGGVRLFGERTSVDLGLWIPVAGELDSFLAIPYLDFVLKFGKKPKGLVMK